MTETRLRDKLIAGFIIVVWTAFVLSCILVGLAQAWWIINAL